MLPRRGDGTEKQLALESIEGIRAKQLLYNNLFRRYTCVYIYARAPTWAHIYLYSNTNSRLIPIYTTHSLFPWNSASNHSLTTFVCWFNSLSRFKLFRRRPRRTELNVILDEGNPLERLRPGIDAGYSAPCRVSSCISNDVYFQIHDVVFPFKKR